MHTLSHCTLSKMDAGDWEMQLKKLKEELNRNKGRCPTETTNKHLRTWVQHQRKKRKENTLDEDKVKALNGMGFVWEVKQAAWEANLLAWTAWQNQDEDKRPSMPPQLKRWAAKQKEHCKKWGEGKTTAGKPRKKTQDCEKAEGRRKVLMEAGVISDHSSTKTDVKEDLSLQPAKCSDEKSHLACCRQLRVECNTLDVLESKIIQENCEELEKDHDEDIKAVEKDERSHCEQWTEQNEIVRQPGRASQRPAETWTEETKPEMPRDWPSGFVFDEKARVLRVDYKIVKETPLFWHCLERDDIAVVMLGMAALTPEHLTLENMTERLHEENVHESFQSFTEKDGTMTETTIPMTLDECKKRLNEGEKIYFSDFSLSFLPVLKKEFRKAVELMMPTGPNCLMRDVSKIDAVL